MLVVYTAHAKRVLATSYPPVYYVPLEDIQMEYLRHTEGVYFCEWKGAARYYDIEIHERTERRAVWFYRDPTPLFRSLKNYVAFYLSLMNACWVDGEKVRVQEGDFYALPSPRRSSIPKDGSGT